MIEALPVKGGGLPNKVHHKVVGALGGNTSIALQLNGHLITIVWHRVKELYKCTQKVYCMLH